ncbi:signal transducer CD24 [Candoia aspera]|uniref:signal transducer CD24 n=1 Tax=Candoia aspera TaxID=51853 RepID=UPI002FD864A8
MGTTLAWRFAFGLLVLALLSPSQAEDNKTSTTPMHNNPNVTSTPFSMTNTTTKGHGNALQSTAGLFILSVSFLYIC